MAVLCATCGKKQPFFLKNKFLKIQDNFYCDDCFVKAKGDYLKSKKPFIEEKLVDIYRDFDKFFSAGFLSIVYAGEYFCICNVVDCCYALILYDSYNKIEDYLWSFPISARRLERLVELEEIIKNDIAAIAYVNAIPTNDFENHLIWFTDEKLEIMEKKKADTEKNGPVISKEYENAFVAAYNVLNFN